MIGSIIGGIGSLIGGIGSIALGSAQKNSNERIADENFQFQQQQFEYQKALNQLQMEREDSAYLRTVNDMRSAGMSPLAMQSTNSSGSLNSGVAPQREQNDYSALMNSLYSVTSQFSQLGQVMSGIKRTDAETNFINAQAEKLRHDIDFDLSTFDDRRYKAKFDARQSAVDAEHKFFNYRSDSYYGFSSGMPEDLKKHLFSIANGFLSRDIDSSDLFLNEDNQYNSVYNYENELKWNNISADTELKKKESDWKEYDKVMSSFSSLLQAFSGGF